MEFSRDFQSKNFVFSWITSFNVRHKYRFSRMVKFLKYSVKKIIYLQVQFIMRQEFRSHSWKDSWKESS